MVEHFQRTWGESRGVNPNEVRSFVRSLKQLVCPYSPKPLARGPNALCAPPQTTHHKLNFGIHFRKFQLYFCLRASLSALTCNGELVVLCRAGVSIYGPRAKSDPWSHSIWPQRHFVNNEKKNPHEKLVDLAKCNISQNNHIMKVARPSIFCIVAYVALWEKSLETPDVE